MNYYVSGINTILDIKDFFFLILSSWSYFFFRITNSYTLYPGSFLVLHYVFSEDGLILVITLCR